VPEYRRLPADAGVEVESCVELPYLEPPKSVRVTFLGRILEADVLFLVDTTGSMTEEIDEISRTLRDTLVPELAEAIGDVNLSVASLADFSVAGYGSDTDVPFQLLQASTDDISLVQDAIDRLPTSNGADGPESQVEALYQAASGEGIGSFVPPARCPEETVGYPCFRREGSRIILLFTDAEFHNGPMDASPYSGIIPAPHSYNDAVNALRGIGAKVLGLFSGGGDREAQRHLETIARDTGAVQTSGIPIVFNIGTRGRELDVGVVETVRTLVEEVPIDIDALVEDVEGDEFDATVFVTDIVAVAAAPPGGAIVLGDRFESVRPGTRVTFEIFLQNELVPPSPEPQSYLMRVIIRGDGVTRLQSSVVQIVIPGMVGGGCPDAVGL